MYLSGWTAVQFQFQFQSGTLSRRPPHAASSSSPPYHAVFISRFLPAASLPSCSRRAASAAAASSSLQPNDLFRTAGRFPTCFLSHLENGRSTILSTLLTFLSVRSAKGCHRPIYEAQLRKRHWRNYMGRDAEKRTRQGESGETPKQPSPAAIRAYLTPARHVRSSRGR